MASRFAPRRARQSIAFCLDEERGSDCASSVVGPAATKYGNPADDPRKKWRARPMKTSCAFLLATGIGCATIADASLSRAQDLIRIGYTSSPSCSVTHSTCFSDRRSSPSTHIRVADDYCTTRCDQRFKYCQYRGESFDYCVERLKTCRAGC